MLRSLVFYILFYSWTLFSIMMALPVSLISADLVHCCAIVWGRGCLKLAGLDLKIEGGENISKSAPAIYIANHQSNFDIPLLYAGLPIQFRWLAKMELFRLPLFGLVMKRSGYIPIDRSDRRKALQSIHTAARKIISGTSVIIFPEGTRTPDGRVQKFKSGALLIAAKAGVPVIPLAISGSYRIQPKGSLKINQGRLKLTILPALETAALTTKDIEKLTGVIHRQIASVVEKDLDYAG